MKFRRRSTAQAVPDAEESMRISAAEFGHRHDLRRMHARPGHARDEAAKSMELDALGEALQSDEHTGWQHETRCSASSRRHVRGPARRSRLAGSRPDRLRRHGHRWPRSASRRKTWRVSSHTVPRLLTHKPRYLMGVGTPEDLVNAGAGRHRHVRLRDADAQCRNGHLFSRFGDVRSRTPRTAMTRGRWTRSCDCYTCIL